MRRPSPLAALVGLVAVVVLGGCIATIAVRAGNSSSSPHTASASPAAVSTAYYDDLRDQKAAAAFALLCPAQQQQGEAMFAQTLQLDHTTGTGIAKFLVTGESTIGTTDASVPGSVSLANGQALAITVLLTRGTGGWQVCSSNLGGVLPAPGASASPSSAV